jgi:hypothetical protein
MVKRPSDPDIHFDFSYGTGKPDRDPESKPGIEEAITEIPKLRLKLIGHSIPCALSDGFRNIIGLTDQGILSEQYSADLIDEHIPWPPGEQFKQVTGGLETLSNFLLH